MDRLLLIDGHNLLFQMFYGMPARIIDREGQPVQGVVGFIGALNKIIKMIAPTHILVIFDGEHENFRLSVNSEYKRNRPDYSAVDDKENPFLQLKRIYRALDVMGIKYFEEDEFEADDIIATYAYRYGENIKIMISSFDSDYFQLITDNVSVLRYRGKNTIICDKYYIEEKFGIIPEFFADFKALKGDNADNIKGIEKIGKITASKLINRFGDIYKIIAEAYKIESASIRNSLLGNEQRLRDNLKLIKLNDIGKLPFCLDELKYLHKELPTFQVLKAAGVTIN